MEQLKKYHYYQNSIWLYLFAFIIMFTFSNCEDVIEVDLNTAVPRLVIDASINWQKGTSGATQKIKLSKTTGYYSSVFPSVSGAIVTVTNSSNVTFNFIEGTTAGEYICTNFNPVINETYQLKVIYNNQTYTAIETLKAVPEITTIEQKNDGGILGQDIEVKFFFQDIINESNSYMTRFLTPVSIIPRYDVFDDRFNENNQMFGLFFDEGLKQGDAINFTLFGISSQYYNYMRIVISQSGSNGGSPFQTPPSTIRGNIINQSNFNNYALGYFRLCETDQRNYIVQ